MEDDPGEAMVYFREVCEMTDEELEFSVLILQEEIPMEIATVNHCNNGFF